MMSENTRPVVVGVDGSASTPNAVRWAAREALRWSAPLRLVHVVPTPPNHVPPPREFRAAIREQARLVLAAAAATAREEVPGLTVTTGLRDGRVIEVLASESVAARLLVLGEHRSMLAASGSIALAAHASCPVVVVRSATVDGAPPVTGPVVVGTDGSDLSAAALEFAFEAAAARGVPLVVVHTWLDVTMTGAWTAPRWHIDWQQVQAVEEKRLAERLVPWRDRYPGVSVRPVVARDRPERVLLHQAEGAQLIVVGTRGRHEVTAMGLSSVSQTLLYEAECPVVVARAE